MAAVEDLEHEEVHAEDVVTQGRLVCTMVNPEVYPPPQYGEAIQATIRWLRGEAIVSPVDQAVYDPYLPSACDH
jgi:hypothetical protein